MIRRDFLKVLGLSLPALQHALAQPVTGRAKTLITIFLRGGVDGLSMVQPTGDKALTALRPGLIHQGAKLDGFFTLHPAMKALVPLYAKKQLAVLHAVGQVNASRSHFEAQDFIESLSVFTQRTALLGALNALSQITLKITMPGVPDLYQGTEFWDLSFVDPDNRRPVDFARRARLMDESDEWHTLAKHWSNGRLKLAWTRHLLAFRHRHAAVFTHGDYVPLAVRGRHRDHVIAFARRHRGAVAIVVTLRHFVPFTDGGTRWPDWRDIDATVDLGEVNTGNDIADGHWLVLNRSLQTIPALVISGTATGHTKKPH